MTKCKLEVAAVYLRQIKTLDRLNEYSWPRSRVHGPSCHLQSSPCVVSIYPPFSSTSICENYPTSAFVLSLSSALSYQIRTLHRAEPTHIPIHDLAGFASGSSRHMELSTFTLFVHLSLIRGALSRFRTKIDRYFGAYKYLSGIPRICSVWSSSEAP